MRVRPFAPGLLALAACSPASSAAPDAGPPPVDTDPTVLGTVTGALSVPCPTGAAAGAACTQLDVACPRLDDLPVVVAVSEPAGPATATVLLHRNLGGVDFFDDGFVGAYHAAGLRVVQARWATDWQKSTVGLKHAACRYATLLQWIFTTVHMSDRTRGFCAQSFGGGSGGLFFALAHYGAGDTLDAVNVSAGPPFARVDLGCDPATPPRSVCPALPSVPVAYSDGVLSLIAGWEEAPGCGTGAPASGAEVARWAADSILSPGATLAFPRTSFAAWYCTNSVDATLGQGAMVFDQLAADKQVHCVAGGAGGGQCTGEMPWPSALPDMVADLTARCVPRHGP